MAAFALNDTLGTTLIMSPRSDSAWVLLDPETGQTRDTLHGMPPADLRTGPIIAPQQRDLFYVEDQYLCIYGDAVRPNQPPSLVSIGAQFVNVGQHLDLVVHASDTDGDRIDLQTGILPPNAVFVDAGDGTGTFSFAPDAHQMGVVEVMFIASDGIYADTEFVSITVLQKGAPLPSNISLLAYPNPFNTCVRLSWPPNADASNLQILNVLGQKVQSYALGEQPHVTSIEWNGCDQNGRAMPSGVYFARLQAKIGTALTKLVLLK
jgi:hypothetical protein